MTKITLTDLANLQNETTAVNAINANNAILETASDNTLSRDGTAPNTMGASFDMNSHQILNLPHPATANSPLRLQDLADFIGSGTISNIPTGGADGQVLTKLSATNYDMGWQFPEDGGFNPYNYGAIGDGIANDATAIVNCINAARAVNGTVVLTDGTFAHNTTINWGWNRLKVMCLGENVKFKHTVAGVAHNFDGMANYPASQGCIGGVFGGPGRIWLEGNATTTNLVNINNWHWGYMKISARNAATALVNMQDTGIVGASAVESVFDIQISPNIDGLSNFPIISQYGIKADKAAASRFTNMTVEGCGTGTSYAVTLTGCVGNTFDTGTVESNIHGGISLDANCTRNVFSSIHAEVNGDQKDWLIAGTYNLFNGCAGAGTTAGQTISGTNNIFHNCSFQSATNSGNFNTYRSCKFATAFTESSNTATITNPSAFATDADNSVTTFGNKSFNTDNNNTLKIASGTALTATTGTGGTVVLSAAPTLTGHPTIEGVTSTGATGTGNLVYSTSPTLTTPVLGTPTSGTVTNLTGTANININGTVGATTPNTVSATNVNVTGSSIPANGIYLPSANTVGLSTASVNKFNVDSTGNVGIGITTPGTYNLGSFVLAVGGISNPSIGAMALVGDQTIDGALGNVQFCNDVVGGADRRVAQIRVSRSGANNAGLMEFQLANGGTIATCLQVTPAGAVQAVKPTAGLGYGTGAGGTVTQGTSRTTGVTLNTVSGAITLFSQTNTAVSGATAQTFTVTNSAVAATDTIIVNQKSGTDAYLTFVTNVAAGSFKITNYTTGGVTNEAPVFTFNVIKGVTS